MTTRQQNTKPGPGQGRDNDPEADDTMAGEAASSAPSQPGRKKKEEGRKGHSRKEKPQIQWPWLESKEPRPLLNDHCIVVLIVKGVVGYGIFLMPFVFMHTGKWIGVFLALLLGAAFTYAMHSLIECAQMLSERHELDATSYSSIALIAIKNGPRQYRKYANLFGMIVTVLLILNMLLCCLIYLSYICVNLGPLTLLYEVTLSDDAEVHAFLCALIASIWLGGVSCVRELRHHAAYAGIGIGSILMAFFWAILFMDHQPVPVSQMIHIGPAPTFSMSVAVGVLTWVLACVGVVLPVTGDVTEPKRLIARPFLLYIGIAIGGILTIYTGLMGFNRAGQNATVNILDLMPINDRFGWPAHFSAVLGMFFSYPLPFHFLCNLTFIYVEPKFNKNIYSLAEYGLRFFFTLILFCLAFCVTFVRPMLLICLIGGLCLSMLGLIIPSAIELAAYNPVPGYGKSKWRLYKNIAFIVLGLIVLIMCIIGAFV